MIKQMINTWKYKTVVLYLHVLIICLSRLRNPETVVAGASVMWSRHLEQEQDQDNKWKSHYLHKREIGIEKVVWQTYFTKVGNRKKRRTKQSDYHSVGHKVTLSSEHVTGNWSTEVLNIFLKTKTKIRQ